MSDWTLNQNAKPSDRFPAKWRWWTLGEMRAAVEKTHRESANFRTIKAHIQYAATKAAGSWKPTPQSVVIDPRGCVLDGMNRFRSDLNVGTKGRWYLTVNNWPESDDAGIDRNKPRTMTQWFKRHFPEMRMGNSHLAVIRWAIRGGNRIDDDLSLGYFGAQMTAVLISEDHMMRALESADEAFRVVFGTPKSKGFSGPIRAAFVRAYGTVGEIEVALRIAATGSRPDDVKERRASPMMRLNNFIRTSVHHAGAGQLDGYGKATTALLAWGRGDGLNKLVATSREAFVCPQLDEIWKDLIESQRKVKVYQVGKDN